MRRALLALTLALATPAPASAHHTHATGHVGTLPAGSVGTALGGRVPAPRVELGLAYRLHLFDRALEGAEAYDANAYGGVTVHLLTASASVALARGTRLELAVPFGIVAVAPPVGAGEVTVGLGDVQLGVAQDLVALLASARRPVSLSLRAGAVLPTGHYAPEEALSVTELRPGPGGRLDLATFNTNASLGGGAWAVTAGLELGWDAGERLHLRAATAMIAPVTETDDGARWGVDVEARLGARVAVVPDVLGAHAGAAYRHHARDAIDDVDERTGEPARRRVGGRDEVTLALALDAWLDDGLSCLIGAELPVWQRVGGVQLVRSASLRVGCALALPL